MSILIVSENPLLKEVINEVIAPVQSEIIELTCEEALTRICEYSPDVMIIDETIPQSYFEAILAEARTMQKIRIIVLNPVQNEIILLDSRRETLRKVDDLRDQSIYEVVTRSELQDSGIELVSPDIPQG